MRLDHQPSNSRRALMLALLALACAASTAIAQGCGGVLSNSCNLTRPLTLTSGAVSLPPSLDTCAPASAFLQGLTLFDIAPGAQLRIRITGLSADADLMIHQPPGVCVSDHSIGAYRFADSGGLPGTQNEEEVLTAAEIAAYNCGWLQIAVVSRSTSGVSCNLSVVCESSLACTLTGPASVASGGIALQLNSTSSVATSVDATFEYSTDGGASWNVASAAAGSPLANPAIGAPIGPAVFVWDSVGDGVGIVAPATGVICRATVASGAISSICVTAPFTVDNAGGCATFCGDCDLNGMGPNILDALTAARLAAMIIAPLPGQDLCCDVNSSGVVEVLDALVLAQRAAGLAVTLICP